MEEEEVIKFFEGQATYRITVHGKVDSMYLHKISGLSVTHNVRKDKTISTLTGTVNDQSALNGILNTLYDYQYSVISVMKLD